MAGTQTSTEKIDNGPTDSGGSGSSTYQPQPIGVPSQVYDANGKLVPFNVTVTSTNTEDDLAYRGGRPGTKQITNQVTEHIPPRYYDGDEFAPASWEPARIADMQRRLIAAGLIPKTSNVHIGVWDATSQAGFRDLLAYANTSGLEYLDALGRYSSGEATNPSGRAPLVTQPSNPDDLAAVFRKAWIDTRGIGVDQARIDRMVASYQADEVAAQTAQYNAAETGGTVTPPPSPQAYAEATVRKEDPTGAQEHDTLGFIDQFRQMVGGWQGG